MAEKHKNIQEEIDLTLQSLDGISKAEANPLLYEKIMNRMNEKLKANLVIRYKYAFISLVVLIINLFSILYFAYSGDNTSVTNSITTNITTTKEEIIKNLATEYSLTNNSYNY